MDSETVTTGTKWWMCAKSAGGRSCKIVRHWSARLAAPMWTSHPSRRGAVETRRFAPFAGALLILLVAGARVGHAQCNPDSVLRAASAITVGSEPTSAAIGDVNGDGIPDLLVANTAVSTAGTIGNNLSLLLGNGDGTYRPALINLPGRGPCGVRLVDLNRDGLLDAVFANYFSNTVSVMRGLGPGGFSLFSARVDYAVKARPRAIAVADLDGDGSKDLVVACNASDSITVLMGAGGVYGGTPRFLPIGIAGAGAWDVVVADFNGDGRPDIAVSLQTAGKIAVFLGTGGGAFAAPTYVYDSSGPVAPGVLAAADVDRDGILDLVVAEATSFAVIPGHGTGGVGDGTFGPIRHVQADGRDVSGMVVADFDGDGIPDVVTAYAAYQSILFQRGLGNGTFLPIPPLRPTLASSVALVPADLDRDGRLDLVSVNQSSNSVSLILNPCTLGSPFPAATPNRIAWAIGGAPVCAAAVAPALAAPVPDGTGGAFLAWSDARGADRDIYAMRLDASGSLAPGWPADGVPVCTGPGDQVGTCIASDASGGIFVGWSDSHTGASQVYVQHLDGTGAIEAGWPVCGLMLPVPSTQQWPGLASDRAGGCYVYWVDTRNSMTMPYVIRLTATGVVAPGWPTGGVWVNPSGINAFGNVVEDGVGGAFVGWGVYNPCYGYCDHEHDYVAHVLPNGSIGQTVLVAGVYVTSFVAPVLATDSPGVIAACDVGNIVGCVRLEGSTERRVDLTDAAGGSAAVAPDRKGGFWTFTQGWAGPPMHLRHINWLGTLLPVWDSGSEVSPNPSSQLLAATDTIGGLYCAWQDFRSGSAALYATRYGYTGGLDPGWTLGGEPLAAQSPVSAVKMIPDGLGGAILAWADARSGTSSIYAQRISAGDLPTATQASLVSVDAAPDLVRLAWYAAGGTVPGTRVERRGADTGWMQVATVLPDGDGLLVYEDRTVVPGARYAYRLAIGSGASTWRTPEHWVSVPAGAVFALGGLIPNPGTAGAVIAFALPSSAPATLELFDLQGRRVAARRIDAPDAGRHELALASVGRLAPGVYLLRLAQAGRVGTTRVCVLPGN